MDNRALIFSNLINGVPAAQVARDFRTGEAEVARAFAFVLRKVKSYCFERRMLPVLGATVEEARRHRVVCLTVLPKLNLDRAPKFGNIVSEPVTPGNLMAVAKDLRP